MAVPHQINYIAAPARNALVRSYIPNELHMNAERSLAGYRPWAG